MRTLDDIKQELHKTFMQSADLAELYGYNVGDNFDERFSLVSLERFILYIVAFCAYTVEQLIYATRAEIEERIMSLTPGRPAWYAQKMRDFLLGKTLAEGSDTYENVTEEERISLAVIKHAVAIDNNTTHKLIIKIAGEDGDGNLTPFTDEAVVTQIKEYINRIKYAGVATELINQEGDTFDCSLKVWYDPLKTPEQVTLDVNDAIKAYLTGLPFNGEYSNMALVDRLQELDGVKIVELVSATATPAGSTQAEVVDGKLYPVAGYFKSRNVSLELKPN